MPQKRIGDFEIYYREKGGESVPVVFIHGAGGNGSLWGYVLKRLEGVHAFAIDLPGHGQSSWSPMDTIKGYADVVEGFIKEVANPCILCGHSMGGAITLELAVRNPEYLKGIILVATGAKLRVAPSVFQSISLINETTASSLVDFMLIKKDEDLKALLRDSLLKAGAEVLKADFTACDRFDLMDRVQEIKSPALILCGENDFMTPMKYSEFLHQKIRNSRLVPIKEAGHMLMLEAPDLLSEEIVWFLKDLDEHIKA